MWPPAIPLDKYGYVNALKVKQVWHAPTHFVKKPSRNYFTLKWYGISYLCSSYSYYDSSARTRKRSSPEIVKKSKRFKEVTIKVDDKGRIHCDDGPAVIYNKSAYLWHDTDKRQYYLRGKRLTFEQFYKRQKNTPYHSKIMAEVLGAK